MGLGMALSFVEAAAEADPELAPRFNKLGELFRSRLWHQLTEELVAFLEDPATDKGKNQIELHDRFISQVERRVNQLQYVRMTVMCARQFVGGRVDVSDVVSAADWLRERLLERRTPLPAGPRSVAALEVASLRLREAVLGGVPEGTAGRDGAYDHDAEHQERTRAADEGKVPAFPQREVMDALTLPAGIKSCRASLDALAPLLEALEGAGEEPLVSGTFHRVSAEFHREMGPPGELYRHGLRYLAQTGGRDRTPAERRTLACDLAVSALVAEDVHDLGTLASHPILDALADAPGAAAAPSLAWLADLVKATQTGDVTAFASILSSAEAAAAMDTLPALRDSVETAKEKVALAAVIETIAAKPTAERSLTLAEVATAAFRVESRGGGGMDADADDDGASLQAERLLMRGMSLGLWRGRIDQVEGLVHIDYVRPRVLDGPGITRLLRQVRGWRDRVHEVTLRVERGAAEVLA